MSGHEHVPVMPDEVLALLQPRTGLTYLDATAGSGGHSELILTHSAPDGRLVALDLDPEQLDIAARRLARFGGRVTLVRSSYRRVLDVARDLHLDNVAGVLIDCGPSRDQLAGRTTGRGRGFSRHADEPLLMSYDPDQGVSAASLLRDLPVAGLKALFGQIMRPDETRAIVRAIIRERERRPIETTGHLSEVLLGALRYKGPAAEGRIPAAYLALRVGVNDEIAGLEEGIRNAIRALMPGGVLAVITFHGLEHRTARQVFRELQGGPEGPARLVGVKERPREVELVTRKPLLPTAAEISANPAARSARVQAVRKL